MPPIFRTATLGDVATLHALVEGAYRGDSARRGWTHEADLLGGQRTDREALGAVVADTGQVVLLLEDEGVLVGCVQVARREDGSGYLGMLTVDPARQAGGLGRRLALAAEAWARDRWAAPRMEMTVIDRRTDLIAWYARLGYAPTGETVPFPVDDPRFGLPVDRDLRFAVLAKTL